MYENKNYKKYLTLILRLTKTSAGFTLLEILVAITVMGILTLVGFASFVSYSRSQAVDQSAKDIKTGIDLARFNAVSRVKPLGCGSNPIDSFRFTVCTNATGQVNNCTQSASNLYEIDALCGTSVVNSNYKARPSAIVTSIDVADCPPTRAINFYTLKEGTDLTSCRIVVSTTDSSLTRTICVDAGGNAYIKQGTASCP